MSYFIHNRAALSYSARRYDSAVWCSKMSRDTFLGEVLFEADVRLEKFAAVPWECACLQYGGRSRWWIANMCFILLFCVIRVLTASIFAYIQQAREPWIAIDHQTPSMDMCQLWDSMSAVVHIQRQLVWQVHICADLQDMDLDPLAETSGSQTVWLVTTLHYITLEHYL